MTDYQVALFRAELAKRKQQKQLGQAVGWLLLVLAGSVFWYLLLHAAY